MPSPDIHQLTPDTIKFGVPDLQNFLAGQGNPVGNSLRGAGSWGATRSDIPGRPDLTLQWTNVADVGKGAVPEGVYRPLTPDNAEQYVRTYETELSNVALAGADAPRHTTFIAGEDEASGRPARLYTAARRPEGRAIHGNIHRPDTLLHELFLTVASTIFRYHTTSSLHPVRIETAGMVPSYTQSVLRDRLEFVDLSPALLDKRQAATTALEGLAFYLAPTARPEGSAAATDLLTEIFDYAEQHKLPIKKPTE